MFWYQIFVNRINYTPHYGGLKPPPLVWVSPLPQKTQEACVCVCVWIIIVFMLLAMSLQWALHRDQRHDMHSFHQKQRDKRAFAWNSHSADGGTGWTALTCLQPPRSGIKPGLTLGGKIQGSPPKDIPKYHSLWSSVIVLVTSKEIGSDVSPTLSSLQSILQCIFFLPSPSLSLSTWGSCIRWSGLRQSYWPSWNRTALLVPSTSG